MEIPKLTEFTPPVIPTTPTKYPVGVLVLTEEGNWYVIRKSGKARVPTARVLESWEFRFTVFTSEVALSKTPTLGKIGFRDGTLIQNMADAKLYLISENKRRQVINPDVWNLMFFREEDVILVSQDETNLHEEGEPLK
jgi:hypothetical protein